MVETLVLDLILLFLAFAVAIATVLMRNLLASAAMLAIYSLLMSMVWANMYALDVAFTEAAVGAGISTILMVGALVITGTREKVQHTIHWPALVIVLMVGIALAYGTFDLPAFGDPDAPIHNYVYEAYVNQDLGKPNPAAPGAWDHHDRDPEVFRALQREDREAVINDTAGAGHDAGDGNHANGDFSHHAPNTVTAVLASYRGFDTMFETAVIFTAGISVILLLRRREDIPPPAEDTGDAAAADRDSGCGDDRRSEVAS
jgi:multicomponent Na+:H+ antiporter subunit B